MTTNILPILPCARKKLSPAERKIVALERIADELDDLNNLLRTFLVKDRII